MVAVKAWSVVSGESLTEYLTRWLPCVNVTSPSSSSMRAPSKVIIREQTPTHNNQRVARKRPVKVDALRNAIVVFTVIHQQAESHVPILKTKEWECNRTHVFQLDINNGDQRTTAKISNPDTWWNIARDFFQGYRKIDQTHVVELSPVLNRYSFQYAHNE